MDNLSEEAVVKLAGMALLGLIFLVGAGLAAATGYLQHLRQCAEGRAKSGGADDAHG